MDEDVGATPGAVNGDGDGDDGFDLFPDPDPPVGAEEVPVPPSEVDSEVDFDDLLRDIIGEGDGSVSHN